MTIVDDFASDAFHSITGNVKTLRGFSINIRDMIDSNAISASQVLSIMSQCKLVKESILVSVTKAGLSDYAKAQFGNRTFDITAKVNVISEACQAVIDEIVNTFPTDANGYLLREKLVDGSIQQRTFTSTQVSSLRSKIDTLITVIR